MNGPLDHGLEFGADNHSAPRHEPGYTTLSQQARGPLIQGLGYEQWLPQAAPAEQVDTMHPEDSGPPLVVTGSVRAGRRRRVVLVAGPVVLVGVVLAAVSVWRVSAPTEPAPAIPTPSPSAAAAQAWCEDSGPADLPVRGNGPGSTSSPRAVILALEYAYYVQRDAARVRVLLAPDGRFGSDKEIQAGIDATPAGTAHCVEASPLGQDKWSVAVTERRPSGSTVVHDQVVTVSTREGRTLVVAVESA